MGLRLGHPLTQCLHDVYPVELAVLLALFKGGVRQLLYPFNDFSSLSPQSQQSVRALNPFEERFYTHPK
jgi:hypothetical protein